MINRGMEKVYWEVEPPQDDVCFFNSLWELVPESAVFYFEGTYDERFAKYLERYEGQLKDQIPGGTIWPKPDVHHVEITKLDKRDFLNAVKTFATPTVSTHFIVYDKDTTLLEYYDAFSDNPLWLSVELEETSVKTFCEQNNVSYKAVQEC